MHRLSGCLLLLVLVAFGGSPLHAQPQTRAYAPENLRELSVRDQERVIALEYSDQSRGRRIPDDQLRFYLDQVNRSNWTFSRIKQDIARSLAGTSGPRPPVRPGNTIRCESDDGRSRTCPTPWRGPSRLVRQLSSAPCVEGRTWQSQGGRVQVGNGCRAEFAAGAQVRPPPVVGDRVTCASEGGRHRTCPWNAAAGQPRLLRQLSSQPCVQGRTWGYDRRGLWVDNGCRAEFGSGRGPGPRPPTDAYSVTCASKHYQRTTCAWQAARGRPQMIEQLSDVSCVQGRSWGYDGGASLWVSGGCRARFGVR
ncbi:DUF3011 domain-containing protein [Luteimonas suaedae]|uniref:DUF3011 domain-containing protein n=1 Tax=Luteimonas suaedae TaxID=2605430 RepID=UPI0011EDA72F|nr:DUF3011 domain-containing protein [Luteimonas suaedae]